MAEPYMTMAEIEAKYPNEWVFLANPTSRGKSLEVTGGCVVLHCTDRAEFIRRVFDFPEVKDGALLFTGPPILDELEVEPQPVAQ